MVKKEEKVDEDSASGGLNSNEELSCDGGVEKGGKKGGKAAKPPKAARKVGRKGK